MAMRAAPTPIEAIATGSTTETVMVAATVAATVAVPTAETLMATALTGTATAQASGAIRPKIETENGGTAPNTGTAARMSASTDLKTGQWSADTGMTTRAGAGVSAGS